MKEEEEGRKAGVRGNVIRGGAGGGEGKEKESVKISWALIASLPGAP